MLFMTVSLYLHIFNNNNNNNLTSICTKAFSYGGFLSSLGDISEMRCSFRKVSIITSISTACGMDS